MTTLGIITLLFLCAESGGQVVKGTSNRNGLFICIIMMTILGITSSNQRLVKCVRSVAPEKCIVLIERRILGKRILGCFQSVS